MPVWLLKLLLFTTVFVIPLLPVQFGFGYELIKVLAFLVLATISGLIFVYLLSKKTIKIHRTKLKIAALIFLFCLSLSSVIGTHPLESLVGKYPYYQGLILYWFLFLFFLMISESQINRSVLNRVVSFSALVVAIIAVYQFIQIHLLEIPIPTYAGRVVATFGQPNLYSGFLLLSLPFAYKIKKYRYWVITVISLGILASYSKAAIILLFALGLTMLYKRVKDKGLLVFGALVILLNALVFSLSQSSGLIWDEIVKPLSQTGIENYQVERRIYIFPVLLEEYSKSPLFGSGIDSINALYKSHFAGFKPELKNYPPLYFNLMNLNIDRSHNYFLDLLIFSGILGLVFYLWLLYLLFKSKAPGYLKVFLVLYLVWVFFQVQSIVQLMLFWLVAGVIDNSAIFKDDKS